MSMLFKRRPAPAETFSHSGQMRSSSATRRKEARRTTPGENFLAQFRAGLQQWQCAEVARSSTSVQ